MGQAVVAAVVLAAGASRRLGEAKQLARVGGERLLERAVRVAQEAGLAPLVVVLGAEAERIRAECALDGADVVMNESWAEGMGASLRCGVRALLERHGDKQINGVVAMTCDMPAVDAGHLRTLARGGERCVASAYAGRTAGVPAYFPTAEFGRLLTVAGDAGARGLLDGVSVVTLDRGELDVDTPESLAQARKLLG